MSKYKILNGFLAAVSIAAVLAGALPQAAWAADDDDTVLETALIDKLEDELQNGSFEGGPNFSGIYSQPKQSAVPYWGTTATDEKIELYRQNNGTYISGTDLQIPDGNIGAELNAAEAGTLYQHILATPGSVLEWGLTHRGRKGADTMLLCIGPRQTAEPAKETPGQSESDSTTPKADNNTDQFMKMGHWLHGQEIIPENFSEGCIGKTIYSRKFTSKGDFEGRTSNWAGYYNGDFSFTKTDELTEEWHVWIIKTSNKQWRKYGSNLHKEYTINDTADGTGDYIYEYTVPEGTNELTFAFSAYSTKALENKEIRGDTVGNLIDDISFRIKYPVTIYTSEGGSGSYYETENDKPKDGGVKVSVDNDNTTDIKKYGTALLDKDTHYTITAKPDTDFTFTGAYVKEGSNGDIFIPADCFTKGSDGTYTYIHTNQVTEDTAAQYPVQTTAKAPTVIKLIFAYPPWIAYDPNGGTYLDTSEVTYIKIDNNDIEFPFTGNNTSYTAAPAKEPEGKAWKFKHWLYKGGTAAGNSTVHYYLDEVPTPTGEPPASDSDTDSLVDMAQGSTEADIINEETDASGSATNNEDDSITFGEDEEPESFGEQEVIDNSELYEGETSSNIDTETYKKGYFKVSTGDGFTQDDAQYLAADGLTFIAQWEYKQTAITQIGYGTQWENSNVGGKVNCIRGYNGDAERNTFTLSGYSDTGRYVSYEAIANPGYTFKGWYELSSEGDSETGKLTFRTSAATYGYTVDRENPVKTLYARFEWNSALATTYVSYVQKDGYVAKETSAANSPFVQGSHTQKIAAEATPVPKEDVLGRKELGNTLSTGFMFDFTAGNVSNFKVDIHIPHATDDNPTYIKSSFGNSIKTNTGDEPTTSNESASDYLGSVILANDNADYLGGTVNLLKKSISKSFDLETSVTGSRSATVVFGIIIDGIYAPGATAKVSQGTTGTSSSFTGLTHKSTEDYQKDNNNGYKPYTDENTPTDTSTGQ